MEANVNTRIFMTLFVWIIGLGIFWSSADESLKVCNDFDGDSKTDVAIYYPASGLWEVYLIRSRTITNVITWGGPNYLPAPGDYDGDGKTDFVVFDSSTGNWYGKLSRTDEMAGPGQFGQPGTWPVPADYDGDRVTDVGVYDPLTGMWYAYSLSKGWSDSGKWGYLGDIRSWENPQTYTVLPMPFDYNQDGVDDLGYYYRGWDMTDTNGLPGSGWSIFYVGANTSTGYYEWGSSGSMPAPGNYRSQTFDVPRGVCVCKLTTTDFFVPYMDLFQLGTYGQTLPVPAGDYDGNGYDDHAVYNYVTGRWTIIYNTGGADVDGREQVSDIFGGPNAVPANIYSTIYALARYSPKPW